LFPQAVRGGRKEVEEAKEAREVEDLVVPRLMLVG